MPYLYYATGFSLWLVAVVLLFLLSIPMAILAGSAWVLNYLHMAIWQMGNEGTDMMRYGLELDDDDPSRHLGP